jgi:hypothetical protein
MILVSQKDKNCPEEDPNKGNRLAAVLKYSNYPSLNKPSSKCIQFCIQNLKRSFWRAIPRRMIKKFRRFIKS